MNNDFAFVLHVLYVISFDTLYNAVVLDGCRKTDDYIQITPFDDFAKIPIKTYVKNNAITQNVY